MTNSKRILGVSLAAVFAISLLGSVYASGHLTIDSASVTATPTEIKKALIHTSEKIPKDGTPFGYGIVTDGSFGPGFPGVPADVIVATTHPGVLDSEKQKGKISSAKWHNHYVKIGAGPDCPTVQVLDISYESPGKVKVKGDKIEIQDVPLGTIGTHFGLAPNSVTSFTTGEYAGAVASFALSTIPDGSGGLKAVCVDGLSPFLAP